MKTHHPHVNQTRKTLYLRMEHQITKRSLSFIQLPSTSVALQGLFHPDSKTWNISVVKLSGKIFTRKLRIKVTFVPFFFLPVCSWPTDAVVQCTPSVEVLTQFNPSRRQANCRRRRQSNNKSNKLDNFHCKQMFQSRKVPWGNVTVRRCGRLRRRSAMKHEQVKIESTRAFYDPVPLVEERGRLIRIGWEVEPSVRVMFSRRCHGRRWKFCYCALWPTVIQMATGECPLNWCTQNGKCAVGSSLQGTTGIINFDVMNKPALRITFIAGLCN